MECTRKLILLIGLTVSAVAQSSDVNDCLSIADNRARLACYDRTLGYTGPSPTMTNNSVANTPVVGAITRTPERPAAQIGTVAAAQSAYDQVIANSLSMRVTKVHTTKSRKVYYYTDTGRIFRKTSERPISFEVNDQVNIEGGFLGAQFLRNQDGKKIKIREVK
ncbi:MAG: hypothetical protein NZ730_09845 [Porticoccaceae bacterium]|nr:hypothetical protein [Porticoccaceae bacterium]